MNISKKRNVHENSLKALRPNNRLQGTARKKRVTITISTETYEQLQESSQSISQTLENSFLSIMKAREEIKLIRHLIEGKVKGVSKARIVEEIEKLLK